MTELPYLVRLTNRLATGVARLHPERRRRHTAYLRACQNPDGGFSGREGESDLYYTGFALRSLAILESLTPEIRDGAARYLRSSLQSQTSVIDFFSLLYCWLLIQASGGENIFATSPEDWPDRVAATLESFRTADGGYAKNNDTTKANSGSTYHSFLVTLCYQLLFREVPDPDRLAQFILSRRRGDGGFVEMAPMRKSGTNPTAAGVGTLQLVDPEFFTRQPDLKEGVIECLCEKVSLEGGIRANSSVPLADLLSTFTASWTLSELGALDRLEPTEIAGYAMAVERDAGGFKGGLWDDGYDVEYTFYGLGVLSLFAS
jgi:geranylgeranyl transferase type-2 subunit beta